ncbi:hypothetical protein AO073_01720 [Pseudomonas syringae ICMP 11293]|uniref:hypothetical protein n=1 Tax=Pseudomonas syringae TaxID=317 RepID=UPI0007306182|nr:hypothetical protein [Pseudomonas syringae]KTB91617.1 hypothetical protein AO073_01720 [Pseudomonas syringae ICMP 11293]
MKRLFPLFFLFLMILSGSAFAYTTPDSCGLTDDGKSIKPYNSDVCPQNLTQLLRISFMGKAGFTSLIEKDVKDSRYDDIMNFLSEEQKNINKRNQESFALIKFLFYGLVLFGATWMIVPSIYNVVHSLMTGETHDKENGPPARYNFWISISVIIGGVLCFIPGFFGNESEEGNDDAFSVYDFFQNFTFMSDLTFSSQFISTYFNKLYSAGLETSNPDQTDAEKKKEMEQSTVYYSVRSTIAGIISTSVVISATSAFNNEIENTKDKSTDWKVRFTTDDVWQPNDNYGIDFEHRFSEDPNQIMWKADPITFAANPESLGNSLAYLSAVNYNKSYRSFDDIDGLAAQAEKLKSDIKTTSFYNNEAGFKQIANDATEIFYRDAQANIMVKLYKEWMKKADEIALLKINYACAKDKSAQYASQIFIDSHTGKSNFDSGISDCVSADWKLMGQNTPEFYATQVKEKTEALQKEYYDARMKINNQYRDSHTNSDLLTKMKETFQKGPYAYFFNLPSIWNETRFTASAQNQFAITSPIITLQSKALDNYVDDAWAVEHGYASRAFNLSKYIRDVSLNVSDQGTSSLKDYQAIMQKLYENDYNASLQNTDVESATIMGFVNPLNELDKCNQTTIHPVTCLQQYGQKISETMADLIVMGVTIKAMSLAANEFGDKKKVKLKKKIAEEDENAGISKKQTAIKVSKVKSNYLQLVGEIMSGISSLMLWIAGIGYVFAMVMKFLMAFSMIGPFVIMYILYIVYSLILILTSVFALFAYSRYNDKNNLVHLAKTLWSFFLSTFIMGTVIVIIYTLNWELTAQFDRLIIPVISFGVGAEYTDSASAIVNSMTMLFVYYIGFMAIGFTSLGYSLKAIQAISDNLGIDSPYVDYGNQFIGKAKTICITFSIGILWVLETATKMLGEGLIEYSKTKYQKMSNRRR